MNTELTTLNRTDIRMVLSVGIRLENETKQSRIIRLIMTNDPKSAKARVGLENAILDAYKKQITGKP